MIDLTQTGKDERGIPQFAANPGGAPANLAVAASRLGAQTAFIGKVGADAFGRYLKEVLAENKVDVSGMAVDASRQIAADKKSMAFTVLFTPKEEAFKADTVDGYVKKVLKQLNKMYGIELRS